MTFSNRLTNLGLAAMLVLPLTGCSSAAFKTDTWVEDVPLNTGEVITVQRTAHYKTSLENGFTPHAALDYMDSSFQWRGRQYKFSLDIMTIAVDAAGDINLVRPWSTQENFSRAACRTPSYWQYKLQGEKWVALDSVEPWTYGLARNLMPYFSDQTPVHVTVAVRDSQLKQDQYYSREPGQLAIREDFVFVWCRPPRPYVAPITFPAPEPGAPPKIMSRETPGRE